MVTHKALVKSASNRILRLATSRCCAPTSPNRCVGSTSSPLHVVLRSARGVALCGGLIAAHRPPDCCRRDTLPSTPAAKRSDYRVRSTTIEHSDPRSGAADSVHARLVTSTSTFAWLADASFSAVDVDSAILASILVTVIDTQVHFIAPKVASTALAALIRNAFDARDDSTTDPATRLHLLLNLSRALAGVGGDLAYDLLRVADDDASRPALLVVDFLFMAVRKELLSINNCPRTLLVLTAAEVRRWLDVIGGPTPRLVELDALLGPEVSVLAAIGCTDECSSSVTIDASVTNSDEEAADVALVDAVLSAYSGVPPAGCDVGLLRTWRGETIDSAPTIHIVRADDDTDDDDNETDRVSDVVDASPRTTVLTATSCDALKLIVDDTSWAPSVAAESDVALATHAAHVAIRNHATTFVQRRGVSIDNDDF